MMRIRRGAIRAPAPEVFESAVRESGSAQAQSVPTPSQQKVQSFSLGRPMAVTRSSSRW